jgi:hypothetical protein
MTKRTLLVVVACIGILIVTTMGTGSRASGRLDPQSGVPPPLSDSLVRSDAQWLGTPLTITHAAYLPYIANQPTPTPRPPLGWEAIGPSEGDAAMDIDVAPDDSRRLYVSTRTGVYRSTDRGATWHLALGGFFRRLVVDPRQPNVLFTGPNDDRYRYGIHKSTDGGNTWTHYSEGMTCTNLYGLSISATNPNTLFTGSF